MIRPELFSQWLQAANGSAASIGASDPLRFGEDAQGESPFAALLEQVTNAADSAAAASGAAGQQPQLRVIPAKLALEALANRVPVTTYLGYESAGAREAAALERTSALASPSFFRGNVEAAAAQYGISARLIDAVIQVESAYNPHAVSHAGAKGLMQLMDDTARQLGVVNAFDPEQNINGGARFLADLLRKYDGNEAVALAAYNAGPGRVDRLGIATDAQLFARMEELPVETQGYVRKVLGILNR